MAEFRDLRPDIDARLKANDLRARSLDVDCEAELQTVKRKYEGKAAELLEERLLLEALRQAENKRLGISVPPQEPAELPPIGDFFLDTLRREGPKSKQQLRVMAQEAGYFPNEETGGRVTHITLANFARSERVLVDENGNYCLPEQVVKNTRERIGLESPMRRL